VVAAVGGLAIGAGARLARNLGTHADPPARANVDDKPER
jgi:hypothetical protein